MNSYNINIYNKTEEHKFIFLEELLRKHGEFIQFEIDKKESTHASYKGRWIKKLSALPFADEKPLKDGGYNI